MSKRKKLLVILLFTLGIGIAVYPTVSNWINQQHGSYAIQELEQNLKDTDIDRQRAQAEDYNARLRNSEEISEEEYTSILNIANGMMGYIQIPKINVNLPIGHGVSEELLSKAIGHLPSTAFPIGGKGNHAVLTGHTGLPSAELFTDLTELQVGDLFHILILGENLTYRIDQIKTVLPDEAEALAAVSDKDYCTLVTCTPYGVNSHRLLVRGEREEPAAEVHSRTDELQQEENPFLHLWLLPAIFVACRLLFASRLKKKR